MLFYGSRYIHHDTTLHKENFWLVRKTSSNCNGYVICPLPPLREQKAFLEGYPRQKKTPWEIKSVLVVVDHPRHHLGEYLGGPSSPSWYNAEKRGGGVLYRSDPTGNSNWLALCVFSLQSTAYREHSLHQSASQALYGWRMLFMPSQGVLAWVLINTVEWVERQWGIKSLPRLDIIRLPRVRAVPLTTRVLRNTVE